MAEELSVAKFPSRILQSNSPSKINGEKIKDMNLQISSLKLNSSRSAIKKGTIEIICYLYILLFTYAATAKLLDYEKFVVQIGQSPLLTAIAGWVAWLVPLLELLIALFLAIPKIRMLGLYSSFCLMVMFTTYIIVILNFSDYIPCSCGGILEKMGWTEHLIFNILFIIMAMVAITLSSNKQISEKSNI